MSTKKSAPTSAPSKVQLTGAITMTDFAHAIGITVNGVKKAIITGRIPADCVEVSNGRPKYRIIDAAAAAHWWAQNSYVERGRRGSDSIDYARLPKEVLQARALRDTMRARFDALRIKKIERSINREAEIESGVVTINQVVAALAESVAELEERSHKSVSAALRALKKMVVAKLEK